MKILSVQVERPVDTDPDLSYLGTYSNTPEEHHIDRKEHGWYKRNEYRYFNLGCGDPEYLEQDYKRMCDYNNSQWWMVGVQAIAKVQFTDNGPSQSIKSGGLWGVESDSSKEYFAELEVEQLMELRDELIAAGFDTNEVSEYTGDLILERVKDGTEIIPTV